MIKKINVTLYISDNINVAIVILLIIKTLINIGKERNSQNLSHDTLKVEQFCGIPR